MRTGRNDEGDDGPDDFQSRSLGYAHWPEPTGASFKALG